MKKSLLALAVLGAFAGAASAQSSVTLWGVVDLSVVSLKNGNQSAKGMASNQLNSNRLGFRGVEDLGGGMTAGFWLESAMSNGDTNTNLNLSRRSTLSLSGGFGEIRLGRDYVPSFWNTVFGDVNGANGPGEGLNLVDPTLGSTAGTYVRANNSVTYFLPSGLGGVYGSVMVAAPQGTVGNSYRGGRLGYGAGPVDVSVAVGQTKTATADKFKVFNIGGSVDLGVAKLYGFVNRNTYGALKQSTWELSAGVPLGQGEFRASFGKADKSGGGTDANDAKMFGFGYIYNLSKRTAVYAEYGRIANSGLASSVVASLNGFTGAPTGAKSQAYLAGVRHSF